MKKILTALAVVLTVIGCAHAAPTEIYSQLTAKNVKETCKATNNWQFRVMPMQVLVIHSNEKDGCIGIKNLLLVITPVSTATAISFTEEQRELTARLTQLYFVGYLNRETPDASGKKWVARLIKRETATDPDGSEEVFYYKVEK